MPRACRCAAILGAALLLAGAPAAAQTLADDPAFTRYRQAAAAFEAKDYARAAALAAESLQHYRDNLQAHYLIGQAALAGERWEDAAAAFRRVVELSPSSFAGHRELAIALERLGRDGEAVKAYETALTLRPDNEPVQTRLAFLHLSSGNRDAALPLLSALAERGSRDPQVWSALAGIRYDAGDLAAGEKAFARAATLRDDGKLWFNLGVVRLRLDDDAGAREAFERAARHPEVQAQAREQLEGLEPRQPEPAGDARP
ncbi:MAG TPA: tetratricopeptide repeat protein [Thermodesulfobacteriota bacterium]